MTVASWWLGPRDSDLAPIGRPAEPVSPAPLAGETGRLTPEDLAALAAVCPASLADLPAELFPASVPPASGRLTGLRIASRGAALPLAVDRLAQATPTLTPTPPADGWLVEPDDWFVPEDRSEGSPYGPAPHAAPAVADSTELAPSGSEATESIPAPPAADPSPVPERATPWPIDGPQTPAAIDPPYPSTDAPAAVEGGAPAGPDFAPPGVAAPAPRSVVPPRAEAPAPAMPSEEGPAPEPPASEVADWPGRFDEVGPPGDQDTDAADFGKDLEPSFPAPPPAEEAAPEPLPAPGESSAAAPPTREPRAEQAPPPRAEPIESFPAPAPAPAPATRRRAEPKPDAAPAILPPLPESAPPRAEPLAPAVSVPAAVPAPLPVGKALFAPPAAAPHPGLGASAAADARAAAGGKSADESHAELFAKNCYPSAAQCAECHRRAFDEWSVSSHAYAYVSPMFHRFEQKITDLSNGTVGHFCTRCHSPVATAMGYPRSTPLGEMPMVAREGVTCIACHRVNQRWGKSNGDRRIEPGDQYAAVYGGIGGEGVARAIADKKGYKVKTSPEEKGPGVAIHTEGRFFDQLTMAEACTSCHQVAVQPGVKLEVVWEQYRASPACKKGVTCQECHMGRVPGVAAGYETGAVAEVNGKPFDETRRLHNHMFYGPGYSVAHPGVFPQHKDAADWTVDEWMQFDWRAGWGTDAFEERVEEQEEAGIDTSKWFPPAWADADDRADAREVIEDNLDRLKTKRRYRELVMENGSKVDGPFFRGEPAVGRDLEFEYVVANLNDGHNLPTASLGAQPQLWANVVLVGPDGRRLWETGYTDSLGDLCDIHSVDVRHGRLPFDKQLFNLQTMFLISGAVGTDREFYLPVNLDIDQVAHLRPGTLPVSVTNHPPFIRMESRSLAPLARKRVKYTVPSELLSQPGRYRLSFRLRSRTEPMYFMRLCEATPEMLRAMVEGTLDIHPQSVEFDVR